MESEGSLPCSLESATGPYPVPDEFSPYFFKIQFGISFPSMPILTELLWFLTLIFGEECNVCISCKLNTSSQKRKIIIDDSTFGEIKHFDHLAAYDI
jgi:hypothetical protein